MDFRSLFQSVFSSSSPSTSTTTPSSTSPPNVSSLSESSDSQSAVRRLLKLKLSGDSKKQHEPLHTSAPINAIVSVGSFVKHTRSASSSSSSSLSPSLSSYSTLHAEDVLAPLQVLFPELPDELKMHVLSFLVERDIGTFASVCRHAAVMANDNLLWKDLYWRRYFSRQPPAAPVPFASAPPSPSLSSRSAPPSPCPRSALYASSPSVPVRLRSVLSSPAISSLRHTPSRGSSPSPSPGCGRAQQSLLPTTGAALNDNRGRKDDEVIVLTEGVGEEVKERMVDGGDDEEDEWRGSCEWKRHVQYRHVVLHKKWKQDASYTVTSARSHTGNVYCIQFDSENDLLISSSQDATAKLWDTSTATPSLKSTLKGHTGPVGSVSFLPSADLAITGSDDKTIRVWNTARGEAKDNCVQVVQTGGEDGVWALQFDAQRLVADSGDKTMGMWDTQTMARLTKFAGHTKFVECLQYDGNLLYSGAQDNDLIMWDMTTSKSLHHFQCCKASVYCLQADDTKLICGSADKSIYCWDLRTRKLLWQSNVNRGWIGGLMFDCSKVISCSSDKTVRVLDVETGNVTSKWQQHTNSVRALKYDENRLVTASFDQTIKMWHFP